MKRCGAGVECLKMPLVCSDEPSAKAPLSLPKGVVVFIEGNPSSGEVR
jgi:hypothetical protein